jgi:hypothetical protein
MILDSVKSWTANIFVIHSYCIFKESNIWFANEVYSTYISFLEYSELQE